MFAEDKKKEMREGLLEKLIDHLMSQPDGDCKEESEEGSSELLGDAKPKAELEIMKVEAKPKEKFKLSDGTEMEDESLEDILKRKKKEA